MDKTFILTGHHDVVSVDSYGHLKDLAFKPYELTKRIAELKLSKEVQEDLSSGEWLFGRGVTDMKYGLALEIELLREITGKMILRVIYYFYVFHQKNTIQKVCSGLSIILWSFRILDLNMLVCFLQNHLMDLTQMHFVF